MTFKSLKVFLLFKEKNSNSGRLYVKFEGFLPISRSSSHIYYDECWVPLNPVGSVSALIVSSDPSGMVLVTSE